MSHIKSLLHSTSVENVTPLYPEKSHSSSFSTLPIVELPSTMSIADAFQALLDNNILSAPVYNDPKPYADPSSPRSYVGFVDMRDLIKWIVFLFDDQSSEEDRLDLATAAVRVYSSSAEGISLSYIALMNKFRAVTTTSTLADVVSILQKGVRRVPVLDDCGRVSTIISQSYVNRFIVEKASELGDDISIPISEAKIGRTDVYCVPCTLPAIDTFRVAENKHVSGVAVVDESGAIVDSTSSRVLKGYLQNPLRSLLLLPISQFLEKVSVTAVPLVLCKETDTLEYAMRQMADNGVHRVYVVDEKKKPILSSHSQTS